MIRTFHAGIGTNQPKSPMLLSEAPCPLSLSLSRMKLTSSCRTGKPSFSIQFRTLASHLTFGHLSWKRQGARPPRRRAAAMGPTEEDR
jgi:hypothetical protein